MWEEFKVEVAKKFCVLDDKGNVIEPYQPLDGQEKAFNDAQEEFGKKTFKIIRPRLSADELNSIKLTADDLSALEGFMDMGGLEKKKAPGVPMQIAN